MLLAQSIERAITRVARRRFDAHTRGTRHVDMHRSELDIPLTRKRSAMSEPFVGVRTETVRNMKRDATRRAADAHGRVEQHRRIDTAAERDRDARIVRQRAKNNADRIENETVGGCVSEGSHEVTAREAPA